MKKEQLNQDLEYGFPYHYVPTFRDNFSQIFVWGWSINYTSAIEFILDEIKKDSQNIESIFDIGCGDGRLTRELSLEFQDKSIVGIDYSEKAIALAKALNDDIEFYNIDITSDSFTLMCDSATLIEVFEHIPLELCEKFVEAIYKTINQDGVLYLTVPHSNVPVSYKHFQHFDLKKLEKYFERYFVFEEVKYIQKNSLLLKIFTKLMNNRLYAVKNNFLNNVYYKFYKNNYFYAKENNCERIYLKLRKRDIS